MNKELSKEIREKNNVALSSVMAAIFLTSFKLIVGFSTNSLGILSEAAHSGLDLVAAIVTFIAIKISSKPADEEHHFGHGKSENISALFETALLLITCAWIIYEVVRRFMGERVVVEVNYWSFIVIIFSIIIDISRTIALKKVAKKYNSQALEADALHFSSDILSSLVVLVGLVGYLYGFHYADSLAALVVAIIVIFISYSLGKRAIDVLLDKAPAGIKEKVDTIIANMPEIKLAHDIKIRNSGAEVLVELKIHVAPGLTIERAHEISEQVESNIRSITSKCEVLVHVEPDDNCSVENTHTQL